MREETDEQVFRAQQTVRFEHNGANAVPHQVHAYAELHSDDGRARALVLFYARRDRVQREEIFVGARLVAMRLESAGAGTTWSVSLEARTAGGRHIGSRHSHYICCPTRSEGRRRPFRADGTGALDWLDYPEPVDSNWSGGYPCNWSPKMETAASALGIIHEIRDVALDLVLTETDGGNAVRLCGPSIRVSDRIWYERRSESTIRGFLASLNPFERFALWPMFSRVARSRRCIRERQSAKRDFAAG